MIHREIKLNRGLLGLLLLLLFASRSSFSAGPPSIKEHPAKISIVQVTPDAPSKFRPDSSQGFIVVSLQDCLLIIDGRKESLRLGDFREAKGDQVLQVANASSTPASLVLVNVRSRSQQLTIIRSTLAPNQESEDASDRSTTLLVAIAPLRLRDVRDMAGEDETWKSSKSKMIQLREGETEWLQPGMHRLRNIGSAQAQFVTIEW
jgi:hypothetical protein